MRGLKGLSHQEKTALEQMLQTENTKIASVINSSATVKELELSLVALAKQLAAEPSARFRYHRPCMPFVSRPKLCLGFLML